jgi:beta-phosphoglucomutase
LTIKAIVFDFDGVLADTERLHLRATQEALATHGWTLDEEAYFERYLGFGDRDLVLEFARDAGESIAPHAVERLVALKADRYRAHLAAGNALYATAAGCVQRLGSRFPLAIASGSLRAEIRDILAASALAGAFRVIVGADDVANGKPAPDPYLRAAALLGIDPSDAVAIEDSRWGLESARGAGLRCVGVTNSYPAHELGVAELVVSGLDTLTLDQLDRLCTSDA